MIIYCPNCKKIIKDTCGYCPHCGLRIYTQEEVTEMGIPAGRYPLQFRSEEDNGASYAEESQYNGYDNNGYAENQGYYAGNDYANGGYTGYEYVQPKQSGSSKSSTIYIITIFVLLFVIGAGAGYFVYDSYYGNKTEDYTDYSYTDEETETAAPATSAEQTDTVPTYQPGVDMEEGPTTGAPVVSEPVTVNQDAVSNDGVDAADATAGEETTTAEEQNPEATTAPEQNAEAGTESPEPATVEPIQPSNTPNNP